MGHIELSRDADLLVVAPATADLLAKMASGAANDLASTALLATDKPILAAPAMNVRMWLQRRDATQSFAPQGRRRELRRAGRRRDGLRRVRAGPHGGAGRDRRRDRGDARPKRTRKSRSPAGASSSPPGRPSSPSIRCAFFRTAPPAGRAMPSRRQRRQRAPRWCWCRVPCRIPIPRACAPSMSRRRSRCSRPSRPRCLPTSRCSAPPSRIGASSPPGKRSRKGRPARLRSP